LSVLCTLWATNNIRNVRGMFCVWASMVRQEALWCAGSVTLPTDKVFISNLLFTHFLVRTGRVSAPVGPSSVWYKSNGDGTSYRNVPVGSTIMCRPTLLTVQWHAILRNKNNELIFRSQHIKLIQCQLFQTVIRATFRSQSMTIRLSTFVHCEACCLQIGLWVLVILHDQQNHKIIYLDTASIK
jgi:hypothetical protein